MAGENPEVSDVPNDDDSVTDESPVAVEPHAVPPPLPGKRGVAVVSLDRHACPKCGGKAEWSASKQMLTCPYCGTNFPREEAGDDALPALNEIEERDLLAELGRLDGSSDEWVKTTRRVQCKSCHAVLVRSSEMVAQHCDFCGAPELLDYEDIDAPIKPWAVLPAKVSQEQAYHTIKGFLASRWFAPSDLKRRNFMDRFHRVYLPYWTFDAAADCPWTADSGTYYWETEYYTDANGKRQSRQVRKTRWRPASGRISTAFDDVTVRGSRGTDPKLLDQVEPFPTDELVGYETRYVSGWQVEHYQVPLKDAAVQGRQQMHAMLERMCGRDVPGDTYRNLRIQPSYSDQTFKHILLPVWLASYRFRGKNRQAIVNAYTGTGAADYPLSPWKITFVVLAILAVIVLFMVLSQ
ncbi:zinc ribbon domain-containing protein [Sulfuriroseicoccus oceanibius]|uniref:Zinc ribbon domain-containing protein n=1 Tax=Sulfuriroseicoccus oceanibius TaxID=2707525 RepID=A0A6B3L4D9_9BACT|nr:zinc ribbon domain-containing protein [Sulfuriroseicoccus oceanibius]QQL45067.1 zinc ribbon domain-containing protein [Sulfuriroseicoccus oceanibius]